METVVSGIRPTGNLHLGNYFGAIQNFLKMQDDYLCFFFIADYHSLTTHPHPVDLHGSVRQVLAEYLACGLNPDKATIYIQSDLPETAELYLFLNMLSYVGELERGTSFKEKVSKNPGNVNAGLLTYPVLMAADIILHKADKVPVGKDQKQHLEMTRNFAVRFNHLYGVDYFPEPQAFNFSNELVKVLGLDGSGKMGKSEGEGNAVFLVDEPDLIRKKVMKAVTDSGPGQTNETKSESIQNLFNLMKLVSSADKTDYFENQYDNGTIRYGDMKKQLAEDIIEFTSPIRLKANEYASDNNFLHEVVKSGMEKAKASASKTIREVREIIGIKKF
ncbi:MAG: tryptophan--tRNA ligase [Chitinophagales bacterium]|nr:tryptophan--tRNA ligase [Chitinophagales bacterium]